MLPLMRSRTSAAVSLTASVRSPVTWLGMFSLISSQDCDGGTDLAGRAVAALETVVLDEGRLQWMEVAGLAETFDRGDLLTCVHDGECQAGVDPMALEP